MSNEPKQNKTSVTDIIQAVCAIISTLVIGVAGIFLSHQSNEYVNKQIVVSRLSVNPYFTLEAQEEGSEINKYIVHNEGGYIENATITFTRVLKLVNLTSDEVVYIPYKSNETNLYSVKDSSFDINLLSSINEIKELSKLYEEYFKQKEIPIASYYFEMLTINYLDSTHIAKSNKYLIGANIKRGVKKQFFLVPVTEELAQEIFTRTPIELYFKHEDFPAGAITKIHGGPSGSGEFGSPKSEFDRYIESVKEYLIY